MKKFAAVVLALVMLLMCSTALAGGDARVENFDARILVRSDGSLEIEELLTYCVKDDINGFTRDIDPSFGSGYGDFTAAYVLGDRELPFTYEPSARKGDEGVYYAEEMNNGLDRYYMFLPCREDDLVTIAYRYTIRNVCARYPDVGVLEFPLLGDAWEMDIDNYRAAIGFERPVADADIRVERADMKMNRCEFKNGAVEFAGTNAGNGGAFKVRLMFPSDVLEDMALTGQSDMKASILASEAEFDALRARNVKLGYALLALMIVWAALMIAAACMVWGRDPRVQTDAYTPDAALPVEPGITPAEISVSLNRTQPAANALAATLLDLARRGYVSIVGSNEHDMAYMRTSLSADNCAPHEQYALDWIMNIGDGGYVKLSDIKRHSRRSAYASEFSKWSGMVKESAEARAWYAPRTPAQKTAGIATLAAFAASLVCGIICISAGTAYETLGFSLFGGSLALFVSGLVALLVSHHTPEGARIASGWNSVRKWMKGDWSAFDLPMDSALWEQLMVYALILDTDSALAEQLDDMDPTYADAMCNSREAVLLRNDGYGYARMAMYGYYCHSTAESMSSHVSSSSGGGSGAGGGGGGGTF